MANVVVTAGKNVKVVTADELYSVNLKNILGYFSGNVTPRFTFNIIAPETELLVNFKYRIYGNTELSYVMKLNTSDQAKKFDVKLVDDWPTTQQASSPIEIPKDADMFYIELTWAQTATGSNSTLTIDCDIEAE